ncbi:ABC transporter permease [Pedobacter cryoconitis]|uniref:Putative permease n=1 Tax=Pedobacter cryoconitis TaxID=188932 RepID=A0A327RUQ8_9SPHI|nr:ABC transporter permease [Pedobacter cryoconitis]RAJ20670.1 putative permease [Pedobacter cryoconitis]
MFRLNLKIAFRNLWKNRGYTLINIAGLSIGMAGCILIFLFISYQLSFDQQYKNKDRIYRVVSQAHYAGGEEEFDSAVPLPLADAMRNDFGMLENVAALESAWGVIKVKDATGNVKIKIKGRAFYVAPDFFKIFDYKWLHGNPEQALKEPNTVALSKETAERFFGDWHQAIGRTINFKNNKELKVTGVFADIPENNSNVINIAISYAGFEHKNQKRWGSISSDSECYILLKPGVTIADLERPKAAFLKKYYVEKTVAKPDHLFQPLKEIHIDERFSNFSGKVTSKSELFGLTAIGVLLLITACINFINLATAQAVGRSKEVGVRKVMGSGKQQLMIQFLTETMMLTLIALLLACAITEIALPGMSALFKEKITFNLLERPVIFLFMSGMVLFVGFLSGFYPAMVMSGFSPALAIKNKVNIGHGGGVLRKVLVVVQFAITIILVTGTLVILMQMKFIREKPLGFNSSAIALLSVPSDSLCKSKFEILKTRILNEPGVLTASFCNSAPAAESNMTSEFYYDGTAMQDFQANIKFIDQDYLKTFGLQLLAGRFLTKSDTIREYVVNETLLKKLKVVHPQDAIGKMIILSDHRARIVGVVKDFNNKSLKESISPILMTTRKDGYAALALKMEAHQIPAVMKNAEKIWNEYYPDQVYSSDFMDDKIRNYYESEQVTGALFKVFAIVIIFISFIGLFGLISFVATQRTKEMAIRKVLGASVFELVSMLNTTFIFLILLANLIAWPVAYIFIQKWLSGYAYRITLNIWPFAAAMFISLMITLITVSFRSYKAAKTNPVDALKYE